MSRTTIILLVALGATLAGFTIATNTTRLRGGADEAGPSTAAGPQTAELGWREEYEKGGDRLVFTVKRIEVMKSGWRASIGIENETPVAWQLSPGAVPDGSFGLSLFESGDAKELDERNRGRTLPAVRAATRYDPELTRILEPGASWKGEISAPGALVAGSWARVVFGTLIAVGKPPKDFGEVVVWITDNAYRLRE